MRRERCDRGHSVWAVNPKTGYRYCQTCHTDRNRSRRRRKSGLGIAWADESKDKLRDRGGRMDTFSRSEIMKARGYV